MTADLVSRDKNHDGLKIPRRPHDALPSGLFPRPPVPHVHTHRVAARLPQGLWISHSRPDRVALFRPQHDSIELVARVPAWFPSARRERRPFGRRR